MIIEENWGDFVVRRVGPYADEMMLHTHGGYYITDGLTDVEAEQINFYATHPVTISFEFAKPIMRGDGDAPGVRSIIPASSQVWNYRLQALRDSEREDSMPHWFFRYGKANLKSWDWWEVRLPRTQTTTMAKLAKKLQEFSYLNNKTYKAIHFLCCREMMGAPAPSVFGLSAPKSAH